MTPWIAILCGWMATAAAMALLWIHARRRRDAGVVDLGWTAAVGVLAAGFAASGDGLPSRRGLIASTALLWSARLASHLARRLRRRPEDARYRVLRDRWGARADRNFLILFQVQAPLAVLFAIPALVAAGNASPLGGLDAAAVLLWLAAVGGETLADAQLERFRADPASRGQVCSTGLWRWSRHPNYFFEWLQWWAYVLLGWNAPRGWLTLLGPAAMYVLLVHVTGVPPAEARMLESRGEAYRRYRRTTSVFFPRPPRPAAEVEA